MTTLTPEQKAYKERTLNQLVTNFARLEEQLNKEKQPEVIDSLHEQLEAMQAHMALLQQELATDTAGEPAADELYRRVANALTGQKFFLAKKLITKLETIEPFYPGIERLRYEAEEGRASRRTRSIAQGGALPEIISSPALAEPAPADQPPKIVEVSQTVEAEPEKRGLARLFEFHIVMSCLVVSLILCIMSGVGGITVLQWLIEGN